MFNYSTVENSIMNIARKVSLLITVLLFFTAIYFLIMALQLILEPPEQPQSSDPVNIVWTGTEGDLFEMYEGVYEMYEGVSVTMPHSESDIKPITDQMVLSEQDSGIPILIVSFFLKHPSFNLGDADIQKIQDKVDEYDEWMTSIMEEYDEIDHYHAGLLQWVKEFTADPDFYNFVYSLSLYSEELEFGEVEDAVDDTIIAYSQQYDDALSIDYEEQELFYMERSDYQQKIEELVIKMGSTLVVFGLFLIVILLFRIENKTH